MAHAVPPPTMGGGRSSSVGNRQHRFVSGCISTSVSIVSAAVAADRGGLEQVDKRTVNPRKKTAEG